MKAMYVRCRALPQAFMIGAMLGLAGPNGALAADGARDLIDVPFEDLTWLQISSASRYSQSLREAPAAVQVISREEILRHRWRTLSEALASLPGVYATTDRAYDYIGARGFLVPGDYNTRFLLLVDGQRINDNVYEQALFGAEFPLDISLVDRIEYVPGPGSSIYGANAVLGVINVFTRRAEEVSPLSAGTFLSQDGWREVRAIAARRLASGASAMVSVSRADKQGRDKSYANLDGELIEGDGLASSDAVAHGLDSQRVQRVFVRYADNGFSLAGRYAQRIARPSSALYGTLFDDGGLQIEDSSSSLLGRYHGRLSDTLSFESRLEYASMVYRADFPSPDDAGKRYINHDETRGDWWSAELRLLSAGWAAHTLIGGVEAQNDRKARQQNYDLAAAINPPVDIDSAGRRLGVYLQDEWALATTWRLNAGVRHDRASHAGGFTSPRLGLIWLPTDATTAKLLAGRAYRSANGYERAYASGTGYLANPMLKPETIRTFEAALAQRLAPGRTLSLSAFHYRIDDLIAQAAVGEQLQYQNRPGIRAEGLEAAWCHQRAAGPALSASLAVNRTRGDTSVSHTPRWIGKLRGSLPLLGGRLVGAAEANAIGRYDYQWNGRPQRQPTTTLVNVSLGSARSAPGADAYLRITNLLDRRFVHPGSTELPVAAVPGEGRVWEIGLSYGL